MSTATVTTTHDHCAVCDWLGREAERTALREGHDTWLSVDQRDGVTHSALYERDAQPGDLESGAIASVTDLAAYRQQVAA